MRRMLVLSLLIAAPALALGATSASASGCCNCGYRGYGYYAPPVYGYAPRVYGYSYYAPAYYPPRPFYGGFYGRRAWGWRGWRRW